MKRTTCTILCVSFILLHGCRSFDPYLLRPMEQNQHLLPPLTPVMDERSFELAYGMPQTEINKTEYINPTSSGSVRTVSVREGALNDKRIQQAMTIMEREINYNICETGPSQGYCVCRVIDREVAGNPSWFVISALTGFAVSFVGFPVGSLSTSVDIELDIQDMNQKLIARYSGIGEDREYGAMYWGYAFDPGLFQRDLDTDISRTANAQAFLQGMDSIKKQIERDAEFLRNKLLTAKIAADSLKNFE